jgi:hypothetical protein
LFRKNNQQNTPPNLICHTPLSTITPQARWSVEVYHREIKQTCGIERCQARTGRAQRNHIFLAIAAWFEQHKLRLTHNMTLYQQNWDVIKSAIHQQIKALMLQAT